jgi:hypothetical membrane protein
MKYTGDNGLAPPRIGRRMTTPRATRALLLAGAFAGPTFVLTVLVQSYTVPGFDPRFDWLSLLSLGPWGFVQITNFVLAGALNLLYAVGLWRTLHGRPSGTFAPILIAIYGLGLITVGVFTTDPASGFPPGSVHPSTPSVHGAIHAVVALPIFLGAAAALAVFVRLFVSRREAGWGLYCAASAILMLVCFFASFSSPSVMARFLDLGVLIGWLGTSIIAVKLLASPDGDASGVGLDPRRSVATPVAAQG